jgi:hypothetical protein
MPPTLFFRPTTTHRTLQTRNPGIGLVLYVQRRFHLVGVLFDPCFGTPLLSLYSKTALGAGIWTNPSYSFGEPTMAIRESIGVGVVSIYTLVSFELAFLWSLFGRLTGRRRGHVGGDPFDSVLSTVDASHDFGHTVFVSHDCRSGILNTVLVVRTLS